MIFVKSQGSLPAYTDVSTHVFGDSGELLEGGLEVFDDAGGEDFGGCQSIGIFKTFVAEPEEVEADFVAFEQVIVAEGVEVVAFLALVTIFGVVAGDEVVEMGAGERVGAQGEVLVGAEVVDPQAFGPVIGTGGFLVEEEDLFCLQLWPFILHTFL